MHEWALAEAILKSATQIAEKENLKEISEVTIKIGELQQVEPQILRSALSQMKTDIFRNAKFHILKSKSTLKCRVCNTTWQLNLKELDKTTAEAIHFVPEVVHTYIKCSSCGSPDFEIVTGRGVWLENIKGAK
jgi:hydrogenase nickel incorporation protein HypA/HybF